MTCSKMSMFQRSRIALALATALFVVAAPPVLAQSTKSAQSAQSATADDSLYQDLGGKNGIRNIVDTFLPIVLADARIKDTFKDADTERLAALLAEQFCELGGGPCKYSGKTMREAHADMALTHAHFNALAEDLQLAMEQHGIAASVQNRLIARLAPMQRDVVSK
jgi:hemoglobin